MSKCESLTFVRMEIIPAFKRTCESCGYQAISIHENFAHMELPNGVPRSVCFRCVEKKYKNKAYRLFKLYHSDLIKKQLYLIG